MYYGSEIFESGFSLQEKNKFVLDIKCTVIGKLTDNMVFFQYQDFKLLLECLKKYV